MLTVKETDTRIWRELRLSRPVPSPTREYGEGCAVDIGAIVEANDHEAIKGFFAINPAEIIVEGSPERVSALTIHPFSFLTLLLSSQFVPVPALRSPLDTWRISSIERKLVFEPGPQNEGSAVAFSSSSSSSSTSFSVPRFVAMPSSGGGGILCLDVASMPLDATEPRLELELRAADNIVAVATSNTSSPPPPTPSSPPASASASASMLLEQRNAAMELELVQLRALVAATSPVHSAKKVQGSCRGSRVGGNPNKEIAEIASFPSWLLT